MLEIRLHRGLDECGDALERLAPHARTPFVAPPWLSACAERADVPSVVFVAYEHGSPVGYVAFEERRSLAQGLTYRFLGHGTSNYLEPVVSPGREEEFWHALFTHMEAELGPAILDLIDLNSESPAHEALRRARPSDHASVPLYPCPEARFVGDWDDTFRALVSSRKRRTEIRKFASRLEALGEVRFEVLNTMDGWAARPGLMDEMAELHADRFAGTLNTALAGDSFETIRSGVGRSMGRGANVSVLRADGVLVSFIIAFEAGRSLTDYVPAFQPALSRFNVGHVHLLHLLRWATEHGFDRFDFAKGESSYKRKWSNAETWNYRHLVLLKGAPVSRLRWRALESGVRAVLWGRARGYNARAKALIGRLRPDRRRASGAGATVALRPGPPDDPSAFKEFRLDRVARVPVPVLTEVCSYRYAAPGPDVRLAVSAGGVRVWNPGADEVLEVTPS